MNENHAAVCNRIANKATTIRKCNKQVGPVLAMDIEMSVLHRRRQVWHRRRCQRQNMRNTKLKNKRLCLFWVGRKLAAKGRNTSVTSVDNLRSEKIF